MAQDFSITKQGFRLEPAYTIPEELYKQFYQGCGSGWIVIDKETGIVEDMAYSNNMKNRLKYQNIVISLDQGTVLKETKTKVKVIASFSCGQAVTRVLKK